MNWFKSKDKKKDAPDPKKDAPDPKKGNSPPNEYGISILNDRIEPVHVEQEDQGSDMFSGMDVTSQSDPIEDQLGNGESDLLNNILNTPSPLKNENEDTSSEDSHSKFDFISTTDTSFDPSKFLSTEPTNTSFDPSKFLSTEPIAQVHQNEEQPSIFYMEKNLINPEKKVPPILTDSIKIDPAKPVQRMNSTSKIQPPVVKKKKKLVGEKAIGFETKKTEESSTPDNLTEESTSDGIITPTASLDPTEESISKLGGTEKKWFSKLPEHISTNSNNLGATNELTDLENESNSALHTEHKVDKFDAIKNMLKDSKYTVFTSDEPHKSDHKEQVVVDGGKSELVVAVAEETKSEPKIEVHSEQIPKIEKNIEKN